MLHTLSQLLDPLEAMNDAAEAELEHCVAAVFPDGMQDAEDGRPEVNDGLETSTRAAMAERSRRHMPWALSATAGSASSGTRWAAQQTHDRPGSFFREALTTGTAPVTAERQRAVEGA